jgi:YhcH/YjgK/YiaL family protein
MIVDQLDNAALYKSVNSRLAKAFDYLKNTDILSLEVGKYPIEGTDVFAVVSEYQAKKLEDAKWEAHKDYADVQFIAAGEEKMGYAPLATMEVKDAYNAEKDIIILKGSGDYVTATAGTFIVFFPQDAHQPCVSTGKNDKVKKVVVKVRV